MGHRLVHEQRDTIAVAVAARRLDMSQRKLAETEERYGADDEPRPHARRGTTQVQVRDGSFREWRSSCGVPERGGLESVVVSHRIRFALSRVLGVCATAMANNSA